MTFFVSDDIFIFYENITGFIGFENIRITIIIQKVLSVPVTADRKST